MKLKEILHYNNSIQNMLDNTPNLDSYVKFRLLGVLKQLESAVTNYNEVRNELLLKYSKTLEDGTIGIFEPNRADFADDADYDAAREEYETARNGFNAENDKLLDAEVSVNISKFNYREIMHSGLSSKDLFAIYDLIEE